MPMFGCRTPGPQTNLQLRRLIVERQAAPEILLSGLVTPEDVGALFEMCVSLPSAMLYLSPDAPPACFMMVRSRRRLD